MSFKDRRYTCFACGAHGDSIDLAQQIFGVSNLEAALQLNADFGLGLSAEMPSRDALRQRRQQQDERVRRFRVINDAHAILCWAYRFLRSNAPDTPDGLTGSYDALLRHAADIDWLLDQLEDYRYSGDHYDLIVAYRNVDDISKCGNQRRRIRRHPLAMAEKRWYNNVRIQNI